MKAPIQWRWSALALACLFGLAGMLAFLRPSPSALGEPAPAIDSPSQQRDPPPSNPSVQTRNQGLSSIQTGGHGAVVGGGKFAREDAGPASAPPRADVREGRSIPGHLGDAGPRKPAPECRLDSDCASGLGCVLDLSSGVRRCLPTECQVDDHCFEGSVCRTTNTTASGPPLRRCMPIGIQGPGASCSPYSAGRDMACQDGLVCVFLSCGKPCVPSSPGDCPPGETCVDEGRGDGPACFRGCETTGCPEEHACIKLGKLSKCARSVGVDCNRSDCPMGQECRTRIVRDFALFQCLRRCQPLDKSNCEPGQVCGLGGGPVSYCYTACKRENGPSACPEGLGCRSVSEDDNSWGCVTIPPSQY